MLTDYLQPGTIYFDGRIFSSDDVVAGIDAVTDHLMTNLCSDSPFVYLFAKNHIKTVLAFFGIIKARRICVVIEPGMGKIEFEEKLREARPGAIIRIDEQLINWDFDVEMEIVPPSGPAADEDELGDVCMMMYTAGDDGYLKAAMLTHDNVRANAEAIAAGNRVGPQTVSMALVPFSHAFGLQCGVITPCLCGGSSVIIPESRFHGEGQVVECITSLGVTHLYAVPVVYYLLCKQRDQIGRNWRSISCISGGYALPDFVLNRFRNSFGLFIRQGYGLTEASPVCSWAFDDSAPGAHSIGNAIGCCVMAIEHSGALERRETSGVGEIIVRGSNVMKGYYGRSDVTGRVLRNGWLHTGDLGWMDASGRFYLDGKIKKMINYAGMKVYPAEVERLIRMFPGIDDVLVYGIAEPIAGEKVCADVTLRHNDQKTRDEFVRWMGENISAYKRPRTIVYAG